MAEKVKLVRKALRDRHGEWISSQCLRGLLKRSDPTFSDSDLDILFRRIIGLNGQKIHDNVSIDAFINSLYNVALPGKTPCPAQQTTQHLNGSLPNVGSTGATPKLIQLIIIRHGHSLHNLVEDVGKDASGSLIADLKSVVYQLKESEELRDAPLTSLGFNDACKLGRDLQGTPQPDVVFVSPLRRTMQTLFGIYSGGAFQNSEIRLCELIAEMRRSERPQNIRNSLQDLLVPGKHAQVMDLSKSGIPDVSNNSDAAAVKSKSRDMDLNSSAEFLNNTKRGSWATTNIDAIDAFIREKLVIHIDSTKTTQPLLPLHLVSEGTALKSVSGDSNSVSSLVDDTTMTGWQESGAELPAERPERFLKTLYDFVVRQNTGWEVVGVVSHNYFLQALLQHLHDSPAAEILGGAKEIVHSTAYTFQLECKDGTCVLAK